ncbi:MAG: hypothetical protein FDZ70_03630 [Actinobacteria bacterium]|nr:MAG: hypothetical protein FDZ70_03630 [Actinomycetota bacterium]
MAGVTRLRACAYDRRATPPIRIRSRMPERPPDRTRRATAAFAAAVALAAAAYVALTAWSAPTFRGSDQYWYVEDTEALATDQPAITHEVFPYFLSVPRDEYWNEPPFIHNVPVLRVWAAAARVLPVAELFDAMLLVNVLCALLGALFAGLASARFTGRWTALGAAAAYLFIPVGFWVTGQGMSEPFSGMLVALALWLVVRWPGRMWPLLAAPAFDLGVFARELARNAVTALEVQFHPGMRVFDITRFAPWADRWPVNALAQAARRAEARSAIGPLVPPYASVVLDTAFDARWVADYAVSPRSELALTTTFPYDDATYRRLLERFSADYLVADSTSRLPALLGATRLGGTDPLTVYRIPPR